MKKILEKIIKILPIVLFIVVASIPLCAEAGVNNSVTGTSECQLDTPDKCLFCPMFEILFNAGSAVAEASYRLFHSDLGKLILIFLAVTLALIILKNMASFGTKEAGTLLNELFYRSFVCVAVYLIITQDYNNILNMTIVPIIHDGLEFVGLGGSTGSPKCAVGEIAGFSSSAGAGTGGLPREIGQMIVGAVCNIEQQIDMLFAYGDWAICRGTHADALLKVFPNPIFIIDAALFYLGGVFFLVAYPWIMADAVLQLGISMALLPFAVAGYAFSGTRTYLPKTFSWILNSLFVFIFMSILITCVLGYIAQLLDLVLSNASDARTVFMDPNRGIAFWGPNMIKIMFILVIGWVYMPEMKELASKFAQGSPLSAASSVGTKLTDAMGKQAEKVANKAVDIAAGATANVATSTWRRIGSTGRQATMGFTARFGHTDANGNKTFTIGRRRDGTMTAWGRLWGERQFTVEKDVNGNTKLRTEHTGMFSKRRYIEVSDKYTTIKQEVTESGRQVRNKVEFKHRFINKYMMNPDGTINTGIVGALFDSNMAQDPQYKQAIVEQLAVEVLKKRGYRVSNYYRSRNVTYDPNNPTKIFVEQVDHSGKVTKFQMDINMKTGQVFTGFLQDQHKTDILHKTERKARIGMHNFFFKSVIPGHYENGNLAFDTWLGTHYEMKHDPVLGDVYERTRRKYWFFGDYETKTFGADGTERHTIKAPSATTDIAREQANIEAKLNGQTVAYDWRYKYEKTTDAHGNPVYTKCLRSGWNAKNYFRLGTNSVSYLGKNVFKRLPKAAVKVTTGTLVKAVPPLAVAAIATATVVPAAGFVPIAGAALVMFNPKKTWNLFRHPQQTFRSIGTSAANLGTILKNDFNDSFGNTWQTGNIESYSASGKETLDSATGSVVKDDSYNKTTYERLDGYKEKTDNLTGEKTTTNSPRTTVRTAYFSNGVLTLDTSAEILDDGTFQNEKTKFKYSEAAQQGHDSLLSEFDGNQVVEGDGSIASNLWHTLASGEDNPNDLLYGFDNILGNTTINGQSTSDFIVENLLAEGRRRHTNKFYTNILASLL